MTLAEHYLTASKPNLAGYLDAWLTTASKKLELNKAALTGPLAIDASEAAATGAVSIPFTSTPTVKLSITPSSLPKDGRLEVTVCEYYRKKSASWDNFKSADLVASFGRHLIDVTSGTSVELGRQKPAKMADLATSRIVVVLAGYRLNKDQTVPKLTLTMKQN